MFKFKAAFLLIIPITCQIVFFSEALRAQQSSSSNIEQNRIALVGGTLIDGSGAAQIENAILLINGEYIEAVGKAEDISIPAGYEVISTEGRTMLPGLWDMHVHLLYAGHTNFPYWHQTYTEQFADIIMPATALQLLQAGVTSARDLGAPPESIFGIRQKIANNEIPGPTLYAAGPQLASPFPDWAQYYRRDISSPTSAESEALSLVELEADILKISGAEQLTIEEVKTVTDIAHARDLLVTAHGRTDAEIAIGLSGGVDEFQHIGTGSEAFPDALINQIAEFINAGGELYWTPIVGLQLRAGTARESRELLDDPENYLGLPTEIVEDIQNSLLAYNPASVPADIVKRKIGQLQEAGVTLLVGTDGGLSGNPHSQGMWQEMLAWVEVLGIEPMRTIYAATGLPAEVMGVSDNVGTLSVGKLADIITVHGDPLIDMGVLSDPELVIKNGTVMVDQR